MGQKTNPNIFRLGKTKIWDSKFFEEKHLDIAKYSFKNLELKNFIFKFFADNELIIYNCKIFYSDNSITIFLSYIANFEITKFLTYNNEDEYNEASKSKDNSNKNKYNEKTVGGESKNKFFNILKFKNSKLISRFFKRLAKNKRNYFKTKNYTKKHNIIYKKKTNELEKTLNLDETKIKSFDSLLKNNFLNKLFYNINFFFKKKPKISLNFYQLNSFTTKNFTKSEIEFIKNNLGRLRYYEESPFLEKGVQFVIMTLKYKNGVNFFAKYLVKEMQKHKRQHFYLTFILKTFKIFNKEEFCTPKNIRILIKGRFNRSRRSRKRILKIGKPMSVIKLNSKIFYTQETSFSANGTFGVKMWVQDDIKKIKNNEDNTGTKKAKI